MQRSITLEDHSEAITRLNGELSLDPAKTAVVTIDLHRGHLDPEHALDTWLAQRRTLSQVVVFWYENIHITVTLAVLCWLWWPARRRRSSNRR